MPALRAKMQTAHFATQISAILIDCPEAIIRHAMADVIGHWLLVIINHEGLKLATAKGGSTNEILVHKVFNVLLRVMAKEKKDTTYKKLKGLFSMWKRLIESSPRIMNYLVIQNQFQSRVYSKLYSLQSTTWTKNRHLLSRRMA